MKTLLLGLGNPILTDDAVGVRLAAECRARWSGAPDLDVIAECSVGGLNLLDVVAGYERLIVIDSIKTKDGAPGDWYQFTGAVLRETMNLSCVHDANFATAIELGRRIGAPLPRDEDIHIFAVEVRDNATFSEQLTAELQRAWPDTSAGIFAAIAELLQS